MSNAFNENTQTDGTFDIEDVQIDAVFQINAAGTTWGSIDGNIENQTDLKNALNSKASAQTVSEMSETVSANATEITTITATLSTFGDVVTYNVDDFATKGQGLLADSALQPNDNITELVNNAGFITSSALEGYATERFVTSQGYITSASVGNAPLTIQSNNTTIGTFTANATEAVTINISVPTTATEVGALPSDTDIGNGITTISVNNISVGSINANQTVNNDINVSVPTDTTELTNNAGFITSNALTGYATETWVDEQGYITGIDSTDVTAALGYTPVNPTSLATVATTGSYADLSGTPTLSAVATSGNYNDLTNKPTIGDGITTFIVNNSAIGTITANQTSAETISLNIPTSATEIGALPSDTTIYDLTNQAQQAALDSGINTTTVSQIASNTSAISVINVKIPNDATSVNQLTTEAFVNSSIASNTANFIGTFNSVAELEAYSGTLTNNDYAFVATTDTAGNTLYDRYKWNGTEWLFEYELNNSSFTAEQWGAINSGITSANVTQIAENTTAILSKQDTLIPGDNITINNNTISAAATTYSPGSGITINNGTIAVSNTIASKSDIGSANLTIQRNGVGVGTFSANATSASTVNISVPTTATEVGALPSSTIIGDGQVIFQKNGTSISTISVNQTATTTIDFTIPTTASDVGALPDTTTIGNGATTITVNSTAIGTITANQTTNDSVNISVPTNTNELTNGAGFITNSALVPYQLIAQNMTALPASGSITLTDNSVNKISATGAVTFTLPTVTDLTKYHQIFVQFKMSTVYAVDLGLGAIPHYINNVPPDMSQAGNYNLYWEYDNNDNWWKCGLLINGTGA